jgi:hypothetical protein
LLTIGFIAAITQPSVRDALRQRKPLYTVTVTTGAVGTVGSSSSPEVRLFTLLGSNDSWHLRVPAIVKQCREISPSSVATLLTPTSQTDENGQFVWNLCATAVRALQSPNALPDGRIMVSETNIDGNMTTGQCAASIRDWRFVQDGVLLHNDNQQIIVPSPNEPIVPCTGYIYRQQPSVSCETDVYGVLVAGFPFLQRLVQTLPTLLINGIHLRPRYPWRDQASSYQIITAWGVHFEQLDDGSFLCDLRPNYTTTDLLVDTIVRTDCEDGVICRPFPVDILVCTDTCPCTDPATTTEAATTTTATPFTTPSTTEATTTTGPEELPTCVYQTAGALCNVASVNYADQLLVDTTIDYFTDSDEITANLNIYTPASPLLFPIVITRPPRCIYDCLIGGVLCDKQPNDGDESDSDGYASLWTIDQAAFTSMDFSGTYTLRPYAAFRQNDTTFVGITGTQPPTFGFHMMANTPGVYEYSYRTLQQVKSHGHYTDQSNVFVTGDCCYSYEAPGLRVNAMRVQTVVFFALASSSEQTSGFSNVFIGFQMLFYVPHTTAISDTRLPSDPAPSTAPCVVAFDSIDHGFLLPMSFVQWEARDNMSRSIATGPLSYNCTSDAGCAIRLIVDGRNDWHLLVWTLQTDNDADVRVQILTPFSPTLTLPESCSDDGNFNQIKVDQQSSTIPLVRMAARVISAVDPQCNPHSITPIDDAVALLHTVLLGGNITSVCKGACVDAR